MSTSPPSPSHAAVAAPSGRGSPLARWLTILGVIGLVGWCGVRIQSALAKRSEVAAVRQQVAEKAAAEAATPVKQAVVKGVPVAWEPVVPIDGTLMPIQEASLGFKVSGQLALVRVRVGDHVKKGALLATLAQADVAAQVSAAAAQVRAAEAQMALSADTAQRTSTLLQAGAASAATGIQSAQQHALSSAQLDGARAQLALARANLEAHNLVAPFSGVVTRAPSGPGGIVAPGVAMFQVQDTQALRFAGTVSEADAALVRPGSPIELTAGGRTVTGRVMAVLPSVDAGTRRVPVEAEFKNDSPQPLLAGTFVRGVIRGSGRGSERVQVLRLPASVLRPGSQDEVMVVAGGRLDARRVQFVNGEPGSILVRAGLAPGELVLKTPSAAARSGETASALEEVKP